MNAVHNFHIALHDNNEEECQAAQILKSMDRMRYRSYTEYITKAVIYYAQTNGKRVLNEPLCTSEELIEKTVQASIGQLEKILLGFAAGCSVTQGPGRNVEMPDVQLTKTCYPKADDLDWDFLNGT